MIQPNALFAQSYGDDFEFSTETMFRLFLLSMYDSVDGLSRSGAAFCNAPGA